MANLIYIDKRGNEVPENSARVAFQVNTDDPAGAAFVAQIKATASGQPAGAKPLSLGPIGGVTNLGTTDQKPKPGLSGVEEESVVSTSKLNVPTQETPAASSATPAPEEAQEPEASDAAGAAKAANNEPAQPRPVAHRPGGRR